MKTYRLNIKKKSHFKMLEYLSLTVTVSQTVRGFKWFDCLEV